MGQVLAGLLSSSVGSVDDPALERYVTRVGWRMARAAGRTDIPWRFRVTDSDEPAANSMIGGQVMISRGLLVHLGSEAELAAVLGHEIAHVTAGHTERSFLSLAEPTSQRSWDLELERDEERQADALAVRTLAQAGYRPDAMLSTLVALYRSAGGESACDDAEHPALATRLARVRVVASGLSPRGELGEARFLRRLEGVVVGAQSDAFALDGRNLLLPRSRWVLALPRGWTWTLENGRPEAHDKAGTQAVFALRISGRRDEVYPSAVAHALRDQPFSVTERFGLTAITGRFSNKTGPPSWATLLELGSSSWLLASRGTDADAHRALMSGLRRWDPAKDRAPSLPRLTLMRFSQPNTLAGADCGADLALLERLNGVDASAVLPKGKLVKCVRAGPPRTH